ncbi:acetyl/propionyl/methylcrotonyl-CoA carboxylase subunit alpha [Sphingomonas sp. ABOLF]|uniref:acetyl/propionyl/methylcrotonyl-CoA carboxylase subunit alpha n=1 Tax=Sphingomonas sp. ABOLF TaxID=1985879 RepID=UPI000F7F6E29|nr:acetyl/propionyl/methylcrotonyl-CoA carboxylase subunit alpha [Sphingomonas sp. ABOLF]RSV15353.1 acetyl/propionyl/methylcrotonyl-CoA carboxylase subunit alpha [Sphingomonas sp. ABOLF]
MIQSLLIANRGEIACRIIGTARRLGIRTVAVYSEADANARHVRLADAAVAIGPAPARESYLVGERILAAARESGAEAIHPGYGFLSENADFAEAVVAAGLVWVGPDPASIRAMGLKDAAKQRMIDAGVPVTPGYLGEDQSPERLAAEAQAIGYPVLIKAVAGGGGKGMRRVDDAAQFAELLQSCRREAASAFGDDRVLIEKYIARPRHIEVQVFGDTHGNVVHLFERDCSLQRRHQKVIEEAPAPGMDPATREAICAAAVRAAKAVDYVGAGTIEFIADASEGLRADRIWFMEMNTRLQVEHPVTEEITGQDLVEWQLLVASGEPLPKRQEELAIDGWAMEARLYAEDPAQDFLPSVGTLEYFRLPKLRRGKRYRIETGVEQGDEISPFYDPMIAKLVTKGVNRQEAIDNLKELTADVRCWPVKTNAGFLHLLLWDGAFNAGDMDTGLIAREGEDLIPDAQAPEAVLQAVAHLVVDNAFGGTATDIRGTWLNVDRGPRSLQGFRLNQAPAPVLVRLDDSKRTYDVVFSDRSIDHCPWVESRNGGWVVTEDGVTWLFREHRASGIVAGAAADGAILSPMPGRVTSVEVTNGAIVTKGQRLVTLEAMKMEHGLVAPFDGTIAELPAAAGAQVREGSLLVRVEREEG